VCSSWTREPLFGPEPREFHLAVVEYRSTTLEQVSREWPLPDVDARDVIGRHGGSGGR
jgi:hypothetical protein